MKMTKLWIICAAAMGGLQLPCAGAEKPADTAAAASGPDTAAFWAAGGLVKGYRGTTIAAPRDQLLYVKKGDRVDLLVTFDAALKKGVKETLTATILQNVIVINVRLPENPDEPGAIELLCNPNEAQYVALSVAQGKSLTIAVRAPGDVELHPMEMASFRKLIR